MSAGWSEPAVVIITGIQASGKSTAGLLLAAWIRAHVPFKKDDRGSDVAAPDRATLGGGRRPPGPDRHDPRS